VKHLPALLLLLAAAASAEPTVEQCVAASASAQEHQKAGRLFEAKRQLELCSQASCPAVVQNDCTRWLADVIASMPSIVVAARVDGVDQQQARVLLDGHLWLAELKGGPEALEPGEHELTVTVGTQTKGRRLVVNVSEKNRLVVFDFASPAQVVTPPPPGVTKPIGRPFPTLPVAFSGLAVAGGALFAGFGLSGKANLDALLKQPCAETKTCNPALVAGIQQRFLIADISLGVGAVSALVAAWQWWAWGTSTVVTVTPAAGGAGVSLSGRW